MTQKTSPISVIMLSYNEERNLPDSLGAVRDWVDEIIVLDMHSEDNTRDIAKSFGAQVELFEKTPQFDGARNRGIKIARNDWILILDADEIVTPALRERIQEEVSANRYDLLRLPRANFALSGFPKFTTGFPEYLNRCFRKSQMDVEGYNGHVHTTYAPKPGARLYDIPASFPDCSLLHYSNPTLNSLLSRLLKYSDAEIMRPKNEKAFASRWVLLFLLIWRPIRYGTRHYFIQQGFRDGWRGLWVSFFFAMYQVIILAKVWEASLHNRKQPSLTDAVDAMKKL